MVSSNLVTSAPLVSVILTLHQNDNARHFQDALKSVIDQTYSNLEILLVADGEIGIEFLQAIDLLRDYSTSILFAQGNLGFVRTIRLIVREKCDGPARARNDGIAAAHGNYVAIMDSDDISSADRIALQHALLVRENLDVVSSNYIVIDHDGRQIGTKHVPLSHNAIKAMCPFICPMVNPAIFAKRITMLQHGYTEKLRFGEDYRLWIELLKGGARLGNHPGYLIYFRENKTFYSRRRGVTRAAVDFKSKMIASSLVSPGKWPLVILIATLTFIARLLPPVFLSLLYRIRFSQLFIRAPRKIGLTKKS